MRQDLPYYWCDWCSTFTHGIDRCEICDERRGKHLVELGRRVMDDGNIDGSRYYDVRRDNGDLMRFHDQRHGVPYFYRDDSLAISNGKARTVGTRYGIAEQRYLTDITGRPVDLANAVNGIVEETVYYGDGQGRRVRYTQDSGHISSLGRKKRRMGR